MSFPSSFPGSIWMPVPNADVFPANSHAAIVIHKTASPPWPTAQAVAQGFIDEAVGPSVHYIVGRDGAIVQCVSEDVGAGGNCCLEIGHDPFWDQFGGVNLNTVTLSIEHVDTDPQNQTPCTQAQINASFALVKYLSQKWNIPASHIKTHASLDPGSRANCPGNYPFQQLVNYIAGATPATPPPVPADNPHFDKAALDEWSAFYDTLATEFKGAGVSDALLPVCPPFTTGIASEWKRGLAAGHHFGPVVSPELSTVDWNGNPIKAQFFAYGRAEYTASTDSTRWFTAAGEMKF